MNDICEVIGRVFVRPLRWLIAHVSACEHQRRPVMASVYLLDGAVYGEGDDGFECWLAEMQSGRRHPGMY